MTSGGPSHSVMARGLPNGFSESHEFSNNAFERLQPKLHWEIRSYEGNRFVLIITNV